VFTDQSNQYQNVAPAHLNSLHDSTLISRTDGDVLFSLTPRVCNQTIPPGTPGSFDFPIIANISVYSPTGAVTLCGESIAAMVAKEMIKNVTTSPLSDLTVAAIVNHAKATLGVL
jgi:hypothetical protein